MILARENRRTRGKTCPSATLSTTNPTWIDPGANPGLRGERPATKRFGTAIRILLRLISQFPLSGSVAILLYINSCARSGHCRSYVTSPECCKTRFYNPPKSNPMRPSRGGGYRPSTAKRVLVNGSQGVRHRSEDCMTLKWS
jgi:hypothetical protein